MTLEFQTPSGKVSDKLLSLIRNEVLKFSHMNKDISRAEVLLKEENTIKGGNKVCEIKLAVYEDDLFVHSRSEKFEDSAMETIKELRKMVKQQVKRQRKPLLK